MKQTFVDKSVSKSKKGLVTLEPSNLTCGQKADIWRGIREFIPLCTGGKLLSYV